MSYKKIRSAIPFKQQRKKSIILTAVVSLAYLLTFPKSTNLVGDYPLTCFNAHVNLTQMCW